MDYFAHGLWSYIIFNKSKKFLWAVFFGLMPDNLSWTIYFFYNLFTGQIFNRPNPELIPNWVFTLYGISHSIIIWGIVILVLYIALKKFPIYVLAAPIAILMDIPTHSREFLPVPFLWPLSDWKFPGFSWANGWFMMINYFFIISFLIYIFYKKKQKQ